LEKVLCKNSKARHNYFLEDFFETGIVLIGGEVKSLRNGKGNLSDSYVSVKEGEVFILNFHISPYLFATEEKQDPLRRRKLLLHKSEIKKLIGKMTREGYTIIPTKVYLKDGKIKVEIALAKGKKLYDKREAIKKKDMERETARGGK